MEDSESNAIFESLNLSPQLFINEILNLVDEVTDEGFAYFLEKASALTKTDTDHSTDLSRGVSYIRDMVKQTLDDRLKEWEKHSLLFWFRVPEGFSLPKANPSSDDDLLDLDALVDTELDAELKSLRDKLALVGKESSELSRELRALEKHSLSNNQYAEFIDEVLELYKQPTTNILQELTTTALDFRAKLNNLKRRNTEEIQSRGAKSLRVSQEDIFQIADGKGLFNGELENLQQFLDKM